MYVSVTFITGDNLLINKDSFVQIEPVSLAQSLNVTSRVLEDSPAPQAWRPASVQTFLSSILLVTLMSRRSNVICKVRCNLRLQISTEPKNANAG